MQRDVITDHNAHILGAAPSAPPFLLSKIFPDCSRQIFDKLFSDLDDIEMKHIQRVLEFLLSCDRVRGATGRSHAAQRKIEGTTKLLNRFCATKTTSGQVLWPKNHRHTE